MIQTINEYEFKDAFHKMDRGNQFSYECLDALYCYLEQLEDDTGEQIELDVIALCCTYSQYDNILEASSEYEGFNTVEDFEERTTVIKIPNSNKLIIENF